MDIVNRIVAVDNTIEVRTTDVTVGHDTATCIHGEREGCHEDNGVAASSNSGGVRTADSRNDARDKDA